MQPIPHGVSEMAGNGCYSQGFVFQNSKVSELVDWYESKKVGFVDVLTEQLADEHQELRLAITPAIIQHVGGSSSKGDDFGKNGKSARSIAQQIRNFDFELNDAAKLHEEHVREASFYT